jgi:multicomponent K+:H+ antiporter subunit D
MLTGMLNLHGLGAPGEIPARTWLLVTLVILSGLAALVAMMRSGIRTFWAPLEAIVPRVLVVEVAPVVALLALCLLMTVEGGAVIGYTETVARSLHEPAGYIEGVLGTEQQRERAK